MKDLPQICHLPYISLEDFAGFAAILAEDGDFPATHGAWETLIDARGEEIWASGDVPIFTGLTPAGFRRFVADSTASASINTLIAYAALLSSATNVTEPEPDPAPIQKAAA
jgi:hypothetical protein